MAKVEGSNPFIRPLRKPHKSWGFLLLWHDGAKATVKAWVPSTGTKRAGSAVRSKDGVTAAGHAGPQEEGEVAPRASGRSCFEHKPSSPIL